MDLSAFVGKRLEEQDGEVLRNGAVWAFVENPLCGFPSSVHAVVELREDARDLHHLTGHDLAVFAHLPVNTCNKMTVIASKQMTGCPKCGSKRLRSAPIPVVSALMALFARKWRYSCPSCQWSGWKRRMRRTDGINAAPSREREVESDKLET